MARRILTGMRRRYRNRFRYLRLALPSMRWWYDLQSWWMLCNKQRLLFIGIALAIPVFLGSVIYYTVTGRGIQHELYCLALNVYHEARGEPPEGQQAVAEVTMNRVASSRYPDTVCKVVYEKRWDRIRQRYVSAFSWTELVILSRPKGNAWEQAWEIAKDVYHERAEPRVEGALFFHATYVKPSWARQKIKVAHIGQHIFYK